MNHSKACCFIGHRKISENDELKNKLYSVIEYLIIKKNVSHFYFGSKSAFNDLCYRIVSDLKEIYPYIQRIYVRAEFPYIDSSYHAYLLTYYEDTYFPESLIHAGKSVYIERNFKIIDQSQYCIVYYDENYIPSKRKKSKRDLTEYTPQSGTKIAYEYAKKKGICIYNMFL